MPRIQQHIDDLDRMVDCGAEKPKIRSQIAFIGREVAALEADYESLAASHAQFQETASKETAALNEQLEKFKSKNRLPPTPPEPEGWGSIRL